ncbi:hypothetical protein [Brachybacterium sp. GPGPB12]|uniref:hypothetical protein n=1 Tax=Brachybacterium sp. GPGPB12 TaxID=3023517 RepID=UPI0031343420
MNMMNQWGNDAHGPGGDPSWLGGKDRGGPGTGADGAGTAESRPGPAPSGDSSWSSDFDSRARPVALTRTSVRVLRIRSRKDSGPRFGEFGDDARERAERRYEEWESGGSPDPEVRNRAAEVGKALVKAIPIVVFLVIFFGFFARNEFFRDSFSFGWIALVVLVPMLANVIKSFRK